VVAVIGDGRADGGMAGRALNTIAVAKDSRLGHLVMDTAAPTQDTIGGAGPIPGQGPDKPALRERVDYIRPR